MEKLKQNHDVAVAWRSFELRPKGSPPMPPEYRDYIENVGRPRFEEMAREQYGLNINSGPFGIDSRPALMGAKYAEAQGAGDAYHQAVFQTYWLHGQSIEDRAMLRTIAKACGLDGDEFWDALDSEEVNLAVSTDIAQAQMLGINSVPALVFEKQYLVSGAQPYEVLVQVVEKLNRMAARKS